VRERVERESGEREREERETDDYNEMRRERGMGERETGERETGERGMGKRERGGRETLTGDYSVMHEEYESVRGRESCEPGGAGEISQKSPRFYIYHTK